MKIKTLKAKIDLSPMILFDDCKRGETSAKTGCTPAGGGGGKKPTDAEVDEFEKDLDKRTEEMGKGRRVAAQKRLEDWAESSGFSGPIDPELIDFLNEGTDRLSKEYDALGGKEKGKVNQKAEDILETAEKSGLHEVADFLWHMFVFMFSAELGKRWLRGSR